QAVIRVESAFNPKAVSVKGAQGLMQLMPETASMLGVRNSFDPQQNIDGGVRHLRGLIDRFGNDLPLALAAYNAGEKAVVANRGIPPYPETRDYVTRVLYHYDGTTNGGSAPPPMPVYRTVGDDGSIVYTNIPPRGRRSSRSLAVLRPRRPQVRSHATFFSSQPVIADPISGRSRRFRTNPQCEAPTISRRSALKGSSSYRWRGHCLSAVPVTISTGQGASPRTMPAFRSSRARRDSRPSDWSAIRRSSRSRSTIAG